MVTKQETLDFIAYLKGLGEKITVESRVEVHRTMFNRYVIDPYYADAKMIRDLCIGPSTPLEIYNVYAAQMAKLNSLWKIIPGFGSVYVEDVIEYLMSQGIGYDDAWSIYSHNDKSVEKSVIGKVPKEYGMWRFAGGSGYPLHSREIFFRLFPKEYLDYLHRTSVSDDTDFTVTECVGKDGFYGYEKSKTEYLGRKHVVMIANDRENEKNAPHFSLGYHPTDKCVDKETLIACAKYLTTTTGVPEVWLTDLDSCTSTTVVRKIK